jgi:protein MpaA
MGREWSVIVRVCVLLVSILAVAGCYEPEPKPKILGEEQPVVLPPAQAPPGRHQLMGRSARGRPIMIEVLGQGEDTTLVMAAIHGDEPAGIALVDELAEHLQNDSRSLQGRRVVLLRNANPDGVAANTRENAHGIDLNRNFTASNRVDNETNGHTALSEPEARALQTIIKDYHPSRIVSIHQPMSCIDYDGPARALATRMAQYCDLPINKIGARPGSIGSYTGEELKIPTITLELPKEAASMSAPALWERYGRALMAAIMYPEHPL